MTAKRQATFPAALCQELGLKAGDTLDLEPHVEEGRKVWLLRRSGEADRPWFGSLRSYAVAAPEASLNSAPLPGRLAGPGQLRARWGTGL